MMDHGSERTVLLLLFSFSLASPLQVYGLRYSGGVFGMHFMIILHNAINELKSLVLLLMSVLLSII